MAFLGHLFKLSTVAFAAAATMSACVPPFGDGMATKPVDPDHRSSDIVGGSSVQNGSLFSRQVALIKVSKTTENSDRVLDTKTAACSGTFIARDVVLTAAHCLVGMPFDQITVQFGVTDQAVSFSTTVNRYVINQNFDIADARPEHDIVLLRTTAPLPETLTLTTLASKPPTPPAVAAAVGYGINYYTLNRTTNASDSRVLRMATLRLESDSFINSNSFSILINDLNGVSHGDSGGPLFILENGMLKQLGIASSIMSESVGLRANYVDVIGQAAWIKTATQELRK